MRDKAPAKSEGKLAASDPKFRNTEESTNQTNTESAWEKLPGAIDYRLLFANSFEAILILTPYLNENGNLSDALISDVNPAFSSLTGIPYEQACGKLIRQILPPDPDIHLLDPLRADIETVALGTAALKTRGTTEAAPAPEISPAPRRGEVFWSPANRHFLYQVVALDQKYLAVIGVDITAQKQALQALQENQARLMVSEEQLEQHTLRLGLTHKLIESREAERQSIANHLHEGLLQALIGIRYAIEEGLNIDKKDLRLARLAAVQATLQREIQILRDYCNELRPPTLAPFSLEKTIRAHVENYQKKHLLPIFQLDLSPDQRMLPESIRLVLYRAFQQIFKGMVLRPQVHHIGVRFSFDETQATLEMQDDGDEASLPTHWFDLTKQEQMELASAFERVEGIGGIMKVEAASGKGTLVRVTVPLKMAV